MICCWQPSSTPTDLSGHDLRDDPRAVTAIRLPAAVRVRFAERGGRLDTLEGPVAYRAGDALVTADSGERWPVSREVFERNYEPDPDPDPDPDAIPDAEGQAAQAGEVRYRKRAGKVLARRIDRPFSVRLGADGDTIRGQPGDWLVQYEPGRHGIVAAPRFAATYRVEGTGGDRPDPA